MHITTSPPFKLIQTREKPNTKRSRTSTTPSSTSIGTGHQPSRVKRTKPSSSTGDDHRSASSKEKVSSSPKEHDSKASQKSDNPQSRASPLATTSPSNGSTASTAHPPAIDRFLQETDTQAARQRGEREGYPAGGAGMSLFLHEWQRTWDGGKTVSHFSPPTTTSRLVPSWSNILRKKGRIYIGSGTTILELLVFNNENVC